MSRRLLAGTLVTLALSGFVFADEAPRFDVDEKGRLRVSQLPAILAAETVTRQLRSGLTTTFAFRIDRMQGGAVGGAIVDIRYELWDEVYQVVAVGGDGTARRFEAASFEDLETWWREVSLVLLGPSPTEMGLRKMRLSLEVVPFSQSEQDDAQRWFARSFGASKGGQAEGIGDAAERRSDSLEQVLGVLMATSIQRRAVVSYHWTVNLPGTG